MGFHKGIIPLCRCRAAPCRVRAEPGTNLKSSLPSGKEPFCAQIDYFSQKNSISSPTGPMQNAMRAGSGGWEPMTMSLGSTVIS